MAHPPQLIVVALVESNEPRGATPTYVLTRRRRDSHLGGYWEFPGGKVEPGEGPPDALRRELREELGIEIAAPTPTVFAYHTYPTKSVIILFYTAQMTSDSPPPQPLESDELRLLTREEVLALNMPAANRVFLDCIESGLS